MEKNSSEDGPLQHNSPEKAAGSKLPWWRIAGPGLVVAATGVGAGDLIAAAVAGTRYGTLILWAALLGAVLKFAVNEGLARWQLVTGTTLLEGWIHRLPPWVAWVFLVYLVVWSFVVAAALMAACGLAAHAVFPQVSVAIWGVLHALAAAALVLVGRYFLLERIMKLFIAGMFAVILICAVLAAPGLVPILKGTLLPTVPEGSVTFILGVVGGVGGSVTIMSYGYWIRERGWQSRQHLSAMRLDLTIGYVLTGLFGLAIMTISAGIRPEEVAGSRMALAVAEHLGNLTGPWGKWLFLMGFWGAVFSSMLGVWQGVPYIFDDFVRQRRGQKQAADRTQSGLYKLYLGFLALPPAILVFAGRPLWLIIVYAVSGAIFMPFLAGTLLYMNNRIAWLGSARNGYRANIALIAALLLFMVLFGVEIQRRF